MAKGETYEEFVDKFKPKLTTDDCYTPENVYETVKAWAIKEYEWEGRPIIRPFWPGGDYQKYEYPKNGVVIDNPPFSILAKILKWYNERGIDFFLFAPQLTCFSNHISHYVCVGSNILYANGALVPTSFVTSRGPLIRSAPDMWKDLDAVNRLNSKKVEKPQQPKYRYPDNVLTASRVALFSQMGIDYQTDVGVFTRVLDSQRAKHKQIFGGGYIVPQEAARQAQEALRQAQEANTYKWKLSERELKELMGAEAAAK
ncbi:hypothetical protein [Acidaminococcus timonensis]|uniref:hypothetical protein n=1 Tax=Acidaminococcus timonensis TaxID=1871002 RepID=UPI0029425E95|nr:hypothetical protein [Acidaminococcus timonensis]